MIEYPEVLIQIAEFYGGSVEYYDAEFSILIYTGDKSSKENYDELLDMMNDINIMLEDSDFKISDYTADHDSQSLEFEYSPKVDA